MNNRSTLLSNPLLLAIGGLIIGLLVGWLLLGAVALSPLVKIVDTDPWDLNPAAKQQWVTMVADNYSINQDLNTARERLRGIPTDQVTQYLRVTFSERNTQGDSVGAARVASFAQVLGLNIAGGGTAQPTTPTTNGEGGGLFGNLGQLLLLLAGLILLVALGLFLYMRMRGAPKPAAAPADSSGGATTYARPESFAPPPHSAPVCMKNRLLRRRCQRKPKRRRA